MPSRLTLANTTTTMAMVLATMPIRTMITMEFLMMKTPTLRNSTSNQITTTMGLLMTKILMMTTMVSLTVKTHFLSM